MIVGHDIDGKELRVGDKVELCGDCKPYFLGLLCRVDGVPSEREAVMKWVRRCGYTGTLLRLDNGKYAACEDCRRIDDHQDPGSWEALRDIWIPAEGVEA